MRGIWEIIDRCIHEIILWGSRELMVPHPITVLVQMLRCPQKIRDEKYSIRVKEKMLHLLLIQNHGGVVDKIEDFHAGDQGSNPSWVFCTFFMFFQTLRANCGFQRTRAIYRLCLSLRGGPDYPQNLSKSTQYCAVMCQFGMENDNCQV